MYYQNDEYDKAIDELALVVHGGTTADGVVVEGLPLAPGGSPMIITPSTPSL